MTLRRLLDQSQKTEISSFCMNIPRTKSVVTLSLWKLRLELLDQQEREKNKTFFVVTSKIEYLNLFFLIHKAVTHVDLEWGFWCKNSEQPSDNCADFQVRYCCPKTQELACDKDGYAWTVWLDRDDPVDSGDWENKDGFDANVVCKTPYAVEVSFTSF